MQRQTSKKWCRENEKKAQIIYFFFFKLFSILYRCVYFVLFFRMFCDHPMKKLIKWPFICWIFSFTCCSSNCKDFAWFRYAARSIWYPKIVCTYEVLLNDHSLIRFFMNEFKWWRKHHIYEWNLVNYTQSISMQQKVINQYLLTCRMNGFTWFPEWVADFPFQMNAANTWSSCQS